MAFSSSSARRLLASLVLVAMAGCAVTAPRSPETPPPTPPAASQPEPEPGIAAVPLPAPDAFDANDPAHLLARCRDRAAKAVWFDAIADCKAAIELVPDAIEPSVELMRAFVTLHAYGDAAVHAKRVLAVRDDDAVAWYYLGWAHRGREQWREAIDAVAKAAALDPARAEYGRALGTTHVLAGDYGSGIAALEATLAAHPGDAKTQETLDAARKVAEEKLAPFERLVAEKSDSPLNHATLGGALQQYGFRERALTELDTALAQLGAGGAALSKDHRELAARIHYNRGELYRELGRADLAVTAYATAASMLPSLSAQSYYGIGRTHLQSGDVAAAIEALERSVEEASSVVDNRRALAEAYARAGRSADAGAEAKRAEDLDRAAKASVVPSLLAAPRREPEQK